MDKNITTTEHKIDKVTYIVTAAASENAKDTLHKKVEKLLMRDLRQSFENGSIRANND